ncbi:MAG: helix-turn-helix transcriptional regulator [Nanoarchaeota archaeon]|nr:helix-turn-helix transcriptional regulator [Nanoarchaeota archaeon]
MLDKYQRRVLEDKKYLDVFKLLPKNGRMTLKELADRGKKPSFFIKQDMEPLVGVGLVYHVPEDRIYWLSENGEIAREKIEVGEITIGELELMV